MYSVETLNYLLALGTILLQVGTVGLLAAYFLRRSLPLAGALVEKYAQWGIWKAFAISLLGSALTLFYSEVIGYPPCPLCWWQRIFLYPQVALFTIALYTKDRTVALYSIALSILGAGVALYQHLLQVLPSGSLPCPAQGEVSCAQRYIFEFGYITFPMMSLSLFVFLIVIMLLVRTKRSS